MGSNSPFDTTVKLLLVGEISEQFTLGELTGTECCDCPMEASGILKAIRSQGDVALVVVVSLSSELPKDVCDLLQLRSETMAVLGLIEEGGQYPSVDFIDATLAPQGVSEAASTLKILMQLAKTRHELAKKTRELSQQKRMLDQVSMAIIGTDLNGSIKSWNQRAESMFGFGSDEVMGQPLSAIFQKGRATDFSMHSLLEPLLIHDRHQFETDIRRRNGDVLPIFVSLSLEKNTQRDIIGVICCCRDISLRRRVEGERREAFQRLTFFIERMPLGFIEWELDGTIRAWNQSAENIFGYSQREAIGQPFTLLIGEAFIEPCRRIFREMRQEKGGNRSQNDNITRDGRVIICDWTNSALVDDKGEVVGFASIVNDVTDQIRIETELKESRESAHAANRSKDEFLAVMSHEVRTPMNSIIGFADLLMESLKSEEDAELVNIIKANAFNLLELINNVLNYSRLEAGEVDLREQETDLDALFQEIEEVTQAEAQEKNLSFRVEFQPETPHHIMADYTELRQVLLNLTANALKFTQEGGVTISVGAQSLPKGEPWSSELLFAVKDTGIGIEDCDQAKLFQSFTQLDSSSTRRFGGTGLGLAICRRIVELWSGRIWAESNINEGSTFYFTLPTRVNANEAAPSASSLLYEEIEDRRFAEIFPLRILMQCSNHATIEIMQKIMASLGYEIAIQQDGIESISHLQDNAYDIIMMDDDIADFSIGEMAEIIKGGQAGHENESASLVVLMESSPQNKNSTPPMQPSLNFINKPIIARNVRAVLRKIAIGRDAVNT
ncbi:PAS domain-containing hybrid sensor histidine kinase/response regulator [Cerasicoccus frondis]|uniref:PAS domain-containing hybrid sensor histidine kinase/response regulator n=1 Tax=Cerasicoccus frondis TaxID=490090 RepID=UPI0028526DDC|nr:PAS domain S-box protein [Cerasicoccus frondis]